MSTNTDSATAQEPNFDARPELEVLPPSAIEQISRGEIDIQINTAKRFPRNIAMVKNEILSLATMDQDTAEACFYSVPRGGKNIQGPSVRLAEIAISCFGNIRVGTRIIETVADGKNPHVIVQAVCHDLQKNIAVTIEKRRRITKKRNKTEPDEDDINLAANAGAAIAFRDAVFKVVPGILITAAFEKAKAVAIGDAKSLTDRVSRALDKFAKLGIQPERVLGKLERTSIEEITLSDLETLFGLHNAIKDGQTTIDEAFPATTAAAPTAMKTIEAPKFEKPAETEKPVQNTAEERPKPNDWQPETPQEKLAVALQDLDVKQSDFIAALRRLDPKKVGKDVIACIHLKTEVAETCLKELDGLLITLKLA